MTELQAENAIQARINGEWDNPDLLKLGPLMDTLTDIKRIIEMYEKSEVKSKKQGIIKFA